MRTRSRYTFFLLALALIGAVQPVNAAQPGAYAEMAPLDQYLICDRAEMRGPVCYNAAATRSVLQYTLYRTTLVLMGTPKAQLLEQIRAAVARQQLRAPQSGAMSYMMSKHGYLTDGVGAWHSHVMFHIPKTDGAIGARTWPAHR